MESSAHEQMLFYAEILTLLNKTKAIIPQTDVITHQRLDELKQKLKDLLPLFVEDDYDPSKVQPKIDNLWNDIEIKMIELKDDSFRIANHLNSINFAYRYWLWAFEEPMPYGYSDKHVEMLQSDSNPSGRHRYNGRPSQIVWETIPVTQNDGLTYYVAIATINQIDAVSSVPSFKNNVSITKISEKILEKTRSNMKEWQRSLDPKRILKIAEFLDQSDNGIANAPMIFMPHSNFVNFERNSSNEIYRVKIDFQFLRECQEQGSPFLTDHQGLIDLRPLEIIDGQHRIRGAMRSQRGHTLKIPIILFPPELQQSGAAKFFAEINTQSVPLNKLHSLFMRHRFGLGSTKPSLNYERYDGTRNTETSRANRRAYEAGAFCSSNKSDSDESLFKLIKLLDENSEKNCIIEIDMWVKTARPWFSSNGPYGPGKIDEDSDNWKLEIRNFFDAFMLVCNETNWWYENSGEDKRKKDERPRWLKSDKLGVNDNGRGNKPYIQFPNTFRALMNQLPLIVNKIRDSGFPSNTEEVIPISKFKEALGVLSNIDWLDPRVKSLFIGTGEYRWQALSAWLSDTINHSQNSPYSLQDVMSENIESVAGKGLLSSIKKADVVLAPGSPTWPTIDNPVKLISNRPINAHPRNVTNLNNSNFESLNEAAKLKAGKHTIKDGRITFALEYGDWCDDNDKVTVQVIWGNRKKRDVSSTLELTKPPT